MVELEITKEIFNLVLRHSKRSVLKHATWENKIPIATSDDNTIPTWLNTSYPKINTAAHSDEFEEQSCLPALNKKKYNPK